MMFPGCSATNRGLTKTKKRVKKPPRSGIDTDGKSWADRQHGPVKGQERHGRHLGEMRGVLKARGGGGGVRRRSALYLGL